MSISSNQYYTIIFPVPLEWIDWVEDLCSELNPIIYSDKKNDPLVSFYFETMELAQKAQNKLQNILCDHIIKSEIIQISIKTPEDWQHQWKKFFHPVIIHNQLCIYPPWEKPMTQFKYEIQIDPGMAFGTGMHFTTQYCLKKILEYQPVNSTDIFIDIGTGSGILSILASLMGYNQIISIDKDSQAIEIAKSMCKLNHCTAQIQFKELDLSKDVLPIGNFVVANILGPIILEFRVPLSKSVQPNGILLLSGIWEEDQMKPISKEFVNLGFSIVSSEKSEGWYGMTLLKNQESKP